MEKIIIDCGERMIRTAVTDEKGLAELVIDSRENGSAVGAVYVGVVRTILPNRFAFVDIGADKNGFLFLTDKKEEQLCDSKTGKPLIKSGQPLLVQVVKDETGQKGAYVTSRISYAGRLCVLIQSGGAAAVAVSKKITDEGERGRLKALALAALPETGYELIIRTHCAGSAADDMLSEIALLLVRAEAVAGRWRFLKAPCLAEERESPLLKNLRDLYHKDVGAVVFNNRAAYEEAAAAVGGYFPGARERLIYDDGDRPIFQTYDIERQITKILNKKVWLRSGGFLVIEQTEACVVIDVNTGKYAGKNGHEQSVLNLNIEASDEIARQLRLRNLSGIIIIDFIDMRLPESKEALIRSFAAALRKDRVSTHLCGLTALGLMEVTRKKTREPLQFVLEGGRSIHDRVERSGG